MKRQTIAVIACVLAVTLVIGFLVRRSDLAGNVSSSRSDYAQIYADFVTEHIVLEVDFSTDSEWVQSSGDGTFVLTLPSIECLQDYVFAQASVSSDHLSDCVVGVSLPVVHYQDPGSQQWLDFFAVPSTDVLLSVELPLSQGYILNRKAVAPDVDGGGVYMWAPISGFPNMFCDFWNFLISVDTQHLYLTAQGVDYSTWSDDDFDSYFNSPETFSEVYPQYMAFADQLNAGLCSLEFTLYVYSGNQWIFPEVS